MNLEPASRRMLLAQLHGEMRAAVETLGRLLDSQTLPLPVDEALAIAALRGRLEVCRALLDVVVR